MFKRKQHICPVNRGKHLNSKYRKLMQNPRKILKPYIKEGMTVMDIGCGPGFFTSDLARMVGSSGRVIAVDLQSAMLDMLKNKLQRSEFKDRIVLHNCNETEIGYSANVDFTLLFYAAHEIKEKEAYFKEIGTMTKAGGQIYIAEPIFHVTKPKFEESLKIAETAGFQLLDRPKLFLSKAAVLTKI